MNPEIASRFHSSIRAAQHTKPEAGQDKQCPNELEGTEIRDGTDTSSVTALGAGVRS